MRLLAFAAPLLAAPMLVVGPVSAIAQTAAETAVNDDPYIWLEEKDSARSLAWVETHNAVTVKRLEADPRYATLYGEALALASAKDRIPMPRFLGGEIYNFWQDADHLRGIWRKTSLADYRNPAPKWQTVLDIDALGKAEGKSWVYKGAQCLLPDETRCLISLSDGGEDAIEVREFDLLTGKFVEGGFVLPRAKSDVTWEDRDHLLVGTEWTPGDLTESGYPYIVKRLTRGQPLADAVEIYRGEKKNVAAGAAVMHDGQGRTLTIIQRALDFFHNETFVVTPAGTRRVAMPGKVSIDELVAGRAILKLDEDWPAAGPQFKAGSLAEVDLAALLANPGKLNPRLVWSPNPRTALEGVGSTKGRLLLGVLDNVRGRVLALTPKKGGGWTTATLKLPDNLALDIGSADSRSDKMFVTASGFTTPTTLYLGDAATSKLAVAKTLPAKFDAGPLKVEQLEAISSDGAKIPYFVVHRKDIAYDGSTPTLMSAYGGFQVSSTPYYSALTGKLWLERGGAFVVANIRGGGEFGPAWHQAGLGVKRQIIYDDFAAVGRDLISRKITSARRLGIQGGSNGGLLMGVAMVQQPDLWNAIAIQIPLLDMIRISKIAAGASWQGEYGDVNADPAVMAFWQKTSPYQNLKKGAKYAEPFIFTTTKDDRTGPQHARKFAARMEEYGLPFYYYENTEGGHGAGADIKQAARSNALTMTYFMRKLMD